MIRVPKEEDRAWKPMTALEASSPTKARQDWDMDLSEDKAEVDMEVGYTPHSMNLGGPWEFHHWSEGDHSLRKGLQYSLVWLGVMEAGM